MNTTRREFLKFSLTGIAAASLPGCATLPFHMNSNRKGKIALPSFNGNKLRIHDWDSSSTSEFELPLQFTHSTLQSIHDKNELFIFENEGKKLVVFDLAKRRIKNSLERDDGRKFYGHGACSLDDKYLVCTEIAESYDNDQIGWLSILDKATLKTIGRIESFGSHPHDIYFLDANTICVSNQGKAPIPSTVAFVSFPTGTLLRKVTIPLSSGYLGHMLPLSQSSVFVAGVHGEPPKNAETTELKRLSREGGDQGRRAGVKLRDLIQYQPAPMYTVNIDGTIKEHWSETHREDLRNNFSICLISENDGLVANASGASDAVTFWKQESFFKTIRFPGMYPSALAVSKDQRELVVGSANGQIKFIDLNSFEEIVEKRLKFPEGPVHILQLG